MHAEFMHSQAMKLARDHRLRHGAVAEFGEASDADPGDTGDLVAPAGECARVSDPRDETVAAFVTDRHAVPSVRNTEKDGATAI